MDVDNATGAPSNVRLVAKTLSPTWMTLSKDGKFLYAVNEVDNFNPQKSGSVSAYAVNAATGALKLLNVVSSEGAIPCHISIHPPASSRWWPTTRAAAFPSSASSPMAAWAKPPM